MSLTYSKLSLVEYSPDFRTAVRTVEAPLEPPGADEVTIRVIYAGVSASEVIMTSGMWPFFDMSLPSELGIEALGVVHEVGRNVTDISVDHPVLWVGLYPRGFSEYFYAHHLEIIPVPAVRKEFLAFPVAGLTAAIGLDEAARVKPGDKVLITAAAGGTGHIAVQWAKKRGAHVIGMTSTNEKVRVLRELGTDRPINYKSEDLDKVLSEEYPAGIDVIWETIGGQVFEILYKHLAPKGRLVVVGGISGYKEHGFDMEAKIPNLPRNLLSNNQTIVGFGFFGYEDLFLMYMKELLEDLFGRHIRVVTDMGENTSDGPFRGLESVVRAVEHIQGGNNIGKVIVKIQEE